MTLESLSKYLVDIKTMDKNGECWLNFEVSESNQELSMVNYQLEMLLENPQSYIIPAETCKRDNVFMFSFNLSSLVSFSDFLRKKSNVARIWEVLYDMVKQLIESRKLLLYERNFLLDEEFIFVDSKNKIKLLYFPINTEDNFIGDLKNLILRLLSRVTHLIPEGDEHLKKISTFIKKDNFSLDTLLSLLRNLRFQFEENDIYQSEKLNDSIKQEGKNTNETFMKNTGITRYILMVFITQAFLALMLIITERRMRAAGFNLLERYVPITIFILAFNYAIYKLFIRGKTLNQNKVMAKNSDENIQSGSFIVECGNICSVAPINNDFSIGETTILNPENINIAWLVHESADGVEKTELSTGNFIIGRSIELADMVIPAKSVGRVHARIVTRDGAYFLLDENSKNGTFINNIRIDSKKEFLLKNGDIVTFANKEYTFITAEITAN